MFALKLFISVGLMLFLLHSIDLTDIGSRLTLIRPWALLAGALVLFLQVTLLAFRWFLICHRMGLAIRRRTVFRFTMEGYFFNQALVSSIGGDAIRMMRLSAASARTRASIESVVLDRGAGMVSLALLIGLMMPMLFRLIEAPFIRSGFAVIVVCGICGTTLFLFLPRLGPQFRGLVIIRHFIDLSRTAGNIARHPSAIFLVLLSFGGHCLTGIVFWVLAMGLDISLSLLTTIVLIPAALLPTLIPVSVAGWGLREGAVVGLLSYVGVGAGDAFALSVIYGLICLAVALPGGPL